MSTLETVNARSKQRHAHKSNGADLAERCPWCGSLITRAEFQRIRKKIEEQERSRVAKVEQNLRQQFARDQERAATNAKAEMDKARREAAALITQTKRDAAAREATIRQEAAKAATAALAPKITEAVNAEKQRAYSEKLKLTEQLDEMKRRLEQRRANELGEQAEVDLYEALLREFPGDQIARVPKGRNGADVLIDVVHQGAVAGRLVLDSKNHGRWSNSFVSKVATDLITHRGDHAIVSSTAMPAGVQQPFHLVDGVIVAQPARVVTLVALLRRHIVATYLLKLGNSMRDEKRDELYSFITSDRCAQLLARISGLTNDLSELDGKEESSHRSVWKRRSELIRSIHTVHSEFTAEIDQIIGGTMTEPSS
jgi:uncharacterized protein DUF2130